MDFFKLWYSISVNKFLLFSRSNQEGNGPIDKRATGAMICPPRLLSDLGGLVLPPDSYHLHLNCIYDLKKAVFTTS